MLSATAVDLTFDDDDQNWSTPRLYRTASVGNSWGVTDIGRGFDWASQQHKDESDTTLNLQLSDHVHNQHFYKRHTPFSVPPKILTAPYTMVSPSQSPVLVTSSCLMDSPSSCLPCQSPSPSPSPNLQGSAGSYRAPPLRSPTVSRPRRRSSQQRVSLIAGRVLIAPIEPPSPPPSASTQDITHLGLRRTGSASSLLSTAASTGPPTPFPERESFLGGRSISEFVIETEIGRGAYGLVKRARELHDDGSLGPPLVIKQIIKSRILADCWKKHPKHGTIPIEIYVMSAISSTPYVLPPRRPWDPSRLASTSPQHTNNAVERNSRPVSEATVNDDSWVDGKVVYGHPNICPLDDFFEDNHYYYLVLPSTMPLHVPNEPPPPTDLFDLVEGYPHGLPASSVRSYLGQIADALCFLHSRGIVHRDVKDENVVLGPGGKCILIDFGSSGLVRKNGWDTFSGTLDYAGPEILRGERYHGKEQDVWAFGVVAYVLLVGECPFMTAAEAQDGLESPFANSSIALDERCTEGKEKEGEEEDGGGALGDAATLVRACLQVEVSARPTFEKICQSRFLSGG